MPDHLVRAVLVSECFMTDLSLHDSSNRRLYVATTCLKARGSVASVQRMKINVTLLQESS